MIKEFGEEKPLMNNGKRQLEPEKKKVKKDNESHLKDICTRTEDV